MFSLNDMSEVLWRLSNSLPHQGEIPLQKKKCNCVPEWCMWGVPEICHPSPPPWPGSQKCSGRLTFISVQLFHYLTLKIRSKLKSKHQRWSSSSLVQNGVYSKRRKHTSMRYPGATEISLRFSHFYTSGQGGKCPLGPSPLHHDHAGPSFYYCHFWLCS